MKLGAVIVVALVVASFCFSTNEGDTSSGATSTRQSEERPGAPEVYAKINALSSCTDLQREFDTAMANTDARPAGSPMRKITLSYATAALDRMKALGCP